MRIKLVFRAKDENASIPLNYNYAVSALIYKTIAESSPEFAQRLHEKGFIVQEKTFKLFTFSRIETKDAFVDFKSSRIFLHNPYIKLQVSSPIDEFLKNFVFGTFSQQTFRIDKSEFILDSAETIEDPQIIDEMRFRALSPVTESIRNDKNEVAYLLPNVDWSEIITRNLQRKHEALYGKNLPAAKVEWKWNEDYFADEKRQKKAEKLIDIKGIKVRGWLAPFSVKGDRELIKLGYETGFGNKNSQGFGMAEVSGN
jgi:CRISPR-associated endoribonuclease Cas6